MTLDLINFGAKNQYFSSLIKEVDAAKEFMFKSAKLSDAWLKGKPPNSSGNYDWGNDLKTWPLN